MAQVVFLPSFAKKLIKCDEQVFRQFSKGLKKIMKNPDTGKPMRNIRKGTREIYLGTHRIAYTYKSGTITFLDLYHKDEQ